MGAPWVHFCTLMGALVALWVICLWISDSFCSVISMTVFGEDGVPAGRSHHGRARLGGIPSEFQLEVLEGCFLRLAACAADMYIQLASLCTAASESRTKSGD